MLPIVSLEEHGLPCSGLCGDSTHGCVAVGGGHDDIFQMPVEMLRLFVTFLNGFRINLIWAKMSHWVLPNMPSIPMFNTLTTHAEAAHALTATLTSSKLFYLVETSWRSQCVSLLRLEKFVALQAAIELSHNLPS